MNYQDKGQEFAKVWLFMKENLLHKGLIDNDMAMIKKAFALSFRLRPNWAE